MPILQITLFERPLEKKRKLVEMVTQAVVDALDCPKDAVRIIINDMPKENYSIAGQLYIDK
ncbi:2-hydroxymuconate tautomerase family protein [Candidatus Borrarchaeum sp.]|uniref:2-hydroxymuconate tautomerase family protein n=1 Tax=Candidatus Borrarchaeum sp. TaxID=2846742 RepID=UPI00257AD2E4|nr:2-hydroxymuconate tautomerase family protein [Candidatus Borrarchaeum sp.]